MQIVIEKLIGLPVARRAVEIVERKGRGHPDTLCDEAAESLSRALCREYLARTGRIQHHNVDKAVLCGGSAEVSFGAGRVTRPVHMIHVGRATADLGGVELNLDALAGAATRSVFARSLRHFDALAHLEIETLIRPTSRALSGLFTSATDVALANDSSMGCGFAPFSETERLVLAVDAHLGDPNVLERHPFVGEDTKVLAIRVGRRIDLTIAVAFVAAHVSSLAAYLDGKAALAEEVRRHAAQFTGELGAVTINAADRPDEGLVYLTATGTSAEAGDDGQVGRGNRANGLITPSRPMTLEALAGKNPVSHVGKLYNLWAHRVAHELARRPDVEEVEVQLASQIGAPITEPQVVHLAVRGPAADDQGSLQTQVREALQTLPLLWRDLVAPP